MTSTKSSLFSEKIPDSSFGFIKTGFVWIMICVLYGSVGLAQGQTETTSQEEEEIFVLDEFQVSSTSLKDTYIASESTTGTRFADKLVDLPYSIDVFTEEMIEDFQLFADDDILSLVGGATSDIGSTETRVRGFPIEKVRDGFRFAMPESPSNVKTRDFIKGP